MVKREQLGEEDDEPKAKGSVAVDVSMDVPEEVLGVILSFLTLREATRTSVLGRSWRYLWTLTPNLDLRAGDKLTCSANWDEPKPILFEERRNYIRWVDRVLALHNAPNLKAFQVLFDLDAADSQHIDRWLNYALSRNTQRLELYLVDCTGIRSNRNPQLCYTFPYKKGNFPNNFKLLKQLYLHQVHVTGASVNFFLGNSPHLELVSLSSSQRISSLKIVRPCPSFKCLEIWSCNNLKNVVIRDSDVVIIKYSGKRIQFELINVPLLTQLWIGGVVTQRFRDVADMFSSVLPQLQMFKIMCFLSALSNHEEFEQFAARVEMSSLKQMVVNNYHCSYIKNIDYVLPIIHLISASPNLQKFVLEGVDREDSENRNDVCPNNISRKIFKMIPRAYSLHLKEVKLVGNLGGANRNRRYDELIMHFVDNSVAVKNIVIDPRCFVPPPWYRQWECKYQQKMEDDMLMLSRAYTKDLLHKLVPSKINLNIL